MDKKLKKNLQDLKKYDRQRKWWMVFSSFIIITTTAVVFDWNHIAEHKLFWQIGTLGILVSISWWYWTMRLIRHLLQHKADEYTILQDIVSEIKSIKRDIKKSFIKDVDINK